MSQTDVPVLIVGGGGAGLTASMLFAKLGVETLLEHISANWSRGPAQIQHEATKNTKEFTKRRSHGR